MDVIDTMLIPKIIHYCWFGGKKKPKLVEECILSWKKYLPEYEVFEWNEANSDLTHPFVKKMYKKKKWAFVADYIRLQKVYEFGGIYLDTDMMVVKGFDELLTVDCFLGAENSDFINVAVAGASIKNKFIKECMGIYDSLIIENDINLKEITIPKLITKKVRDLYHYKNDFDQIVDFGEIKIYPSSFFYSLPCWKKDDINNYTDYINENTFAIHLWSSSWVEYSEFYYLRRREYIIGLKITFKNIYSNKNCNMKYLKKILSCFKESINYKR